MTTRSRAPLLLGLALTAALAACEPASEHLGPIPDGWFLANLQGAQTVAYKGTGYFHSNKDVDGWPDELPKRFFLYSSGLMESAGKEVVIVGGNGDAPRVGSYELGWSEGGAHDWSLVYTATRGDSIDFFGARVGELQITTSTKDSIGGKFDATAVGNLVCHKKVRSLTIDPDSTPQLPCATRTGATAAEIQVKGSFRVISGRPCVALADNEAATAEEPRPPVVLCF